jgi:hypothetical protein
LTKRPSSPNVLYDSCFKYAISPKSVFLCDDLFEALSIDWDNLFSQYCVFNKKKTNKEFIATHSDDVYSSLLKLSEYIENELSNLNLDDFPDSDVCWRIFFWRPMLVLSGQLVSSHTGKNGTPELKEVNRGLLEFNWHAGDRPQTTLIEVITEECFIEQIAVIIEKDAVLERKMYSFRQQRSL